MKLLFDYPIEVTKAVNQAQQHVARQSLQRDPSYGKGDQQFNNQMIGGDPSRQNQLPHPPMLNQSQKHNCLPNSFQHTK